MESLRTIGKYEVLSDILGDGGFCCVYPCQHNSPAKTQVAVKISLKPVEDCENDLKWTAFKREWQMYQSMAFGRSKDGQSSGIPAVYECGFVQTVVGTHIWMSMQLLGPDLRKLANNHQINKHSHFTPYATGMLAALQHVHQHGIVHRDVKPANFCLAAGNVEHNSKVYIVDFGLAGLTPDAERAKHDNSYMYRSFQGTPDYASRNALNGLRSSPKDDLESLGYSLLELLQEDLPWDLTSKVAYEDGDYFSQRQLSGMADKRDALWKTLCAQGKIPTFLINWQRYIRSLETFETPSYAWLFRLIQRYQEQLAAHTPCKRMRDDAVAEHTTGNAKRLMAADDLAPEE